MVRSFFLMLPIVFCTTFSAIAQRNTRPDRTQSNGSSIFDRNPQARPGSMLPTLNVVDERGQVFSTGTLRGSYTILVFGCLT